MHCLLMQQNQMSVTSWFYVAIFISHVSGLEWDGRCRYQKVGI